MSDKILLYDRIKELSYTTGSGNIVLEGAANGFSSFSSAYSNNQVLFYAITDGTNYEIGSGVLLRSDFVNNNITNNQIVRHPIRTSTNSIINWSTGLKEVYVTYPASHSVYTGSGIGSYNNPQVSGLAIWGGSHTLDYDPNLVWNSTLNRLGINKSNPSFAIDIGGQSYESIINASGYIVGNSGINFSSGRQTEHFSKNKLDIDAYNASLISQTTGLSNVVELSGSVNEYLLLKKQNAGLFFAGPPSGCGAPPCNPNFPSFRTITMSDLPPLSDMYVSYSSGVNNVGKIAFWSNNNTINSDQYFVWDAVNHRLSLGKPGIAPISDVEISGIVDILGRLNISSGIRLAPLSNISSGNNVLYQNANRQLVFNNEPYVSSGNVELMVSNAVSSFLLNDLNLNIALSGKSFIPTGTILHSEVSGINGQLLLDNQYLYAYTPSGEWRRIYLGNYFDVRQFGDNSFIPPEAPTNLSGVPKNKSVHLTWTTPVSSLGIIDYIVEYSGVANSGWLTYGSQNFEPRENVNGLINGNRYYFRVAAVSPVGSGPYSNVFSSIPNPTTPFAPLITSVANNNIDSITLNWNTPDNGGASITNYQLEYIKISGVAQYLNVGPVNTFTLNNSNGIVGEVSESPNGGAFYTLRVRAINSVGSGNYSTPVSLLVRSIGPPSPPRSVQLESVTFDSATLSFILPDFAGHPGEPVSSLDYRALVRFENFDETALAISGSFGGNNGYFYPIYLNSGVASLSGTPMPINMTAFKNITFYGVSNVTQSGVSSYPTNTYDLYNRYDQAVNDTPSADLRRLVNINNLDRDKLYTITLQSFNNNYNSSNSNAVIANTTNPPIKPTNFIGFAESNSGIILNWTNPEQVLPIIDHSVKLGTPSVFCLNFEDYKDFDRGTTQDVRVYNSANVGTLTINKLGNINYSLDSANGSKSIILQGLNTPRGLYSEVSKDLEFGLNDFTIECFAKFDDVNKESILFDFRKNGLNPDSEGLEGEYFLLRVKPNGRLEYRDSEAQRSGFVTNSVLSTGVWHHIAFSRFNNLSKIFVDGIAVSSGYIDNLKYLSSPFAFGYDTSLANPVKNFSGKVDGVRVINGVGLYVNNFTKPNYNFVDTQYKLNTNNYQVLNLNFEQSSGLVGNSQLSPISKNGASGLFIPGNGSNGFLRQFSNKELAFGIKDFTVESWIYPLALDNEYFLFDFRPTNKNSDPGGTYFLLTVNQNRGLNYYTDGKNRISTSGNLSLGTWNKVEVSRNQGTTRIFVNGLLAGSLESDRFNFLNQNCRIGYTAWNNRSDYINQNFIGYIDDVRILKGVGLYTTNHVVENTYSTSLYAPSDYSSVILNFEEVIDDSLFLQGATISNTNKKFGNSSLFFPSSGTNSLYSDISSNLHFGQKDFTIEAWLNPTSISGNTTLFDFRPSNTNSISINDSGVVDGTYMYITLNSDRSISYITDGQTRIRSSGSVIPSGSWSHVALSRKDGVSRLFINGIQQSGNYIDSNNFQPQSFRFGNTAWTSGVINSYNGYVDLIKISKVGSYTSNFTPPNNTFVEITDNKSYPSILLDYNNQIVDKTNQSPITIRSGTSTGNIIKFGSSSLYMGVSPSVPLGIETDESYLFTFGKNDFTVETWIYPTDLSSDQSIFDFRPSQGGGEINSTDNGTYFHLDISSNKSLRYKAGDTILSNVAPNVILENTWQHIAVSRLNNITRLFINGVQVGSDIVDNNNFTLSRFRIGPSVNPSKNFRGYLDETRILNGNGIYANNFTTQSIPHNLGVKNHITSLVTKSDSIGPNNYTTVLGLDANQEYLFKIAPESVAGVGEYSDLISVKTGLAFNSIWSTTNVSDDSSLNNEIKLPLVQNGEYNFYISWGDGKFDNITNSNYATKSLHRYANPGQYNITIQGLINGWQFKEDGDILKIQQVKSWGPLNFVDNIDRQFQGCSNLVITAKDSPKIGNTLNACFSDCINLNDSLENWDVSRCLDMDFMFLNCVAYNGDISKWDVSNVKSMRAMFLNALSFNRDIGRWDTGKVFNMNSMLTNASSFNQDISLMRIDSLVDANRMLIGTDMSKQNYDKLLEFWGDIDTPKRSDVAFGISQEYSKNSIADANRQALRDQYDWVINDYGSDNSFVFKIKSDEDDFTFNLGDFFKINTNDNSRGYSAMYINFGDESFLDVKSGSTPIVKNYFDKLSRELTVRIDGSISNFNTKYNDSRKYIVDIARWGGVSTFINNIPDRFFGCSNLLSVTAEDAPLLANSLIGFFSGCELLGSVDDSEYTSNFILSFGLNLNGQLGYDTSTASNPFPRKTTNKRWRKLSTGLNHTLAIDNQGYLWSWGRNSSGQLGHGDRTTRITPARISNKTWLHVAAGRDHSLAIDTAGKLYSFGSNAYGQIGDGTNNNRLTPVIIDEIDTQWSYVAAGHDFSIAISDDGELYCWGNNQYGQLGTGDIVSRNVPTKIGIKTWSVADAGRDHVLALDSSNNLYSWGNNAYGQLGLGNNNNANTPTLVSGKTWKKISAGEFYSLGIDNLDKAFGWGNNAYGQLGNQQGKNSGNKINYPSVIRNDLTFKNIYAGYRHSAAVQTSKDLWLWGDNTNGQLGYQVSQIANSEVPVKLNSTNDFGDVVLGEYHTSALLDEPPISSTSLENWNMVNVTDISSMFKNCSSFNVDINSWNTSSVINMSNCFAGAVSYNRSLNDWKTSNVIDMSYMFAGAISFDSDIASWETYNVKTMSNMFNGAASFDKNIGFWDISNVKDMSFMFTNATSLSTRNYSNILVRWSTAQVQRQVTLHSSSYYDGSSVSVMSARNYLLSNDWVINDLGAINV